MLITALLTCVVAAQTPTESDTIFQPERQTEVITTSVTRAGDEAPPTITISEPVPNARLPYGNISFHLIASDESALSKVMVLTDDGRTLEYPLPPGTRTFDRSVTVPALGAGVHVITARAIDRSSNEDDATVRITVAPSEFNMSGPEVGFTTPNTSTLLARPGTPIVLRGWAKDDQQVVSLTWTLSGAISETGTLAGTNAWNLTLPELGLGVYTFSIFASDRSRRSATAKVTVRVQNNTTPGSGSGSGNETSGDIKKDAKKCGAGGGIAVFLLLFGALAALQGRRRIE
jgi:hypothetical protein